VLTVNLKIRVSPTYYPRKTGIEMSWWLPQPRGHPPTAQCARLCPRCNLGSLGQSPATPPGLHMQGRLFREQQVHLLRRTRLIFLIDVQTRVQQHSTIWSQSLHPCPRLPESNYVVLLLCLRSCICAYRSEPLTTCKLHNNSTVSTSQNHTLSPLQRPQSQQTV
jgi:hypothetical protein